MYCICYIRHGRRGVWGFAHDNSLIMVSFSLILPSQPRRDERVQESKSKLFHTDLKTNNGVNLYHVAKLLGWCFNTSSLKCVVTFQGQQKFKMIQDSLTILLLKLVYTY